MWALLLDVAKRENLTVSALVSAIETNAVHPTKGSFNLTAAVRLYVMNYFRAAATEEGHRRAGHGEGAPFAGMTPAGKSPTSDAC